MFRYRKILKICLVSAFAGNGKILVRFKLSIMLNKVVHICCVNVPPHYERCLIKL